MPKGLLDKLTREEILDLVAYVAARGDAKTRCSRAGTTTATSIENGPDDAHLRPRGRWGHFLALDPIPPLSRTHP